MFYDPVGLSNELFCEGESFSCCRSPHRFFQSEVLRLYLPMLEAWVAWSVSSPVIPPGLSALRCGTTCSISHRLAKHPLHPGCPSPPLLPVWMNLSFITPWLLDFRTVRFSGSSGWFLFLNLLLFFFLLVVRGGKVYLPTPLSWLEVYINYFKFLRVLSYSLFSYFMDVLYLFVSWSCLCNFYVPLPCLYPLGSLAFLPVGYLTKFKMKLSYTHKKSLRNWLEALHEWGLN